MLRVQIKPHAVSFSCYILLNLEVPDATSGPAAKEPADSSAVTVAQWTGEVRQGWMTLQTAAAATSVAICTVHV
jgi:hypothetical protein